MKRKFLSLVLCLTVILSLFTQSCIVFAEDSTQGGITTIYVDSSGDNSNDGLTEETPLKDIPQAVNKVNSLGLTGKNRVITVINCEWNGMSLDMSSCSPYEEMITLRCKSASKTIWTTTDMKLAGPLTIDAIYGNSSTQSGLNVYTNGYEFVLGSLAMDAKGATSIYAGYDKNIDTITVDETTGYIEYGKDIDVSILSEQKFEINLYAGNVRYNDVGVIQYGNANILIDAPNVTVKTLYFGTKAGGTNQGNTQTNRFGTISLTVNNVSEISSITGGTYFNAVYTSNLQFLFNNGTSAKITNNIVFGSYGNTNIQATNKWIINGEESDCYLETTDTAGVYNVIGGKVANAFDGTNTYYSGNSVFTLDKGNYDVAYEEPMGVYVDTNNGADTNDGLTEGYPLKSLTAAVNKVNTLGLKGDNRVITVIACGWNGMNPDMTNCTPYEDMITLRCKKATDTIWITTDIRLAGPFTIDAKYGNSKTQTSTVVYTYGNEFVFGPLANDEKGTTSVYMGYHTKLGLTANNQVIEWGKNLTLNIKGQEIRTIPTLLVGNNDWLDSAVQYGDANIVIDNPNLTISTFKIGNGGTYNSGVSTQMNRFENINLTVNGIAEITSLTGATYYNAVYTSNLQFVFNNGTSSKITNNLTFGSYGNKNIQATNKWIMNGAENGGYLEVTETAGAFKVCSDVTAVANDGTNTYYSKNGMLTVPAGTYTVTYEDIRGVYVDSTNGSNENSGTLPTSPLKSLKAAVDKINELGIKGNERLITVLKSGWNELSFDLSGCQEYDEMITITSEQTLWTNSDMHLAGPLTLDCKYGNSNTQVSLNIYTHGYDFVLGEKALDDKGDTSIYAGYDKKYDSIDVSDDGYIHYGKDINIAIKTQQTDGVNLYIGNYAYNDVGIVQYENVNIEIDSPNITIPVFKIGNNGNYNVGYKTRMNRFKDFTVIVNSVAQIESIKGDTFYNGSLIDNLQFIYNNATYSKVTNNLKYGNYGDTSITYTNRWILKENTDTLDSVIDVTEEAGVFKVVGLKVAVATNQNDKVYTSADGVLSIPEGEYVIDYEKAGEYIFADGVLTAIEDIEHLNVTNIAPSQKTNLILLGWKTENGEFVSNTSSVKMKANEKLYAVYTDFGDSDFHTADAEYRHNFKTGLRFIITKGDLFDVALSNVSNITYGYLVLPQYYIDLGETLTVENENAVKGIKGEGLKYYEDTENSYSVVITEIKESHYSESYNVCGFVSYTDCNGNIRTVYSNIANCSLLEAASNALKTENLNDEQKDIANGIIAQGTEYAKTSLKGKVNTLADTVYSQATGTVYYVSEANGDDSNNGKSTETPWKSLKKVNEATLSPGDVVLFERGGTYRPYVENKTHKSIDLMTGVSYGAYGTGKKPVISGSDQNYANTDWKLSLTKENVYYIYVNYNIDPGVLRVTTNNNLSYDGIVQGSLDNLDKDWEFYYDMALGIIYLYCPYGDPNNLLKDIEIGFGVSMFRINDTNDITIENLSFNYIGRHAIAATANSTNITIRGCDFNYIGGCLSEPNSDPQTGLRLGNAIEFLDGGKNVLIKNCSFNNIFDSGVTFQGGTSIVCEVENFIVRDNIFNKCGLGSFEYWLGSIGTAKSVIIENNYMENAGMGIGGTDVRLSGSKEQNAHIRADGINRTSDFIIKRNYFDNTSESAYLVVLSRKTTEGGEFPVFINNAYIQGLNKKLMLIKNDGVNTEYIFDDAAYENLIDTIDNRPIIIYK